jgi:2-(1,2-epoxy-1,2-dihydrophenyl)acetyl-CoA isomerase
MNLEHLKSTIENQTAIITLNRPEVLNSFNRKMSIELIELLDAISSDPDIRCIFLTGEGRAFCAGQDLAEAIAPGTEIADIVATQYNPIIQRIRTIEKPFVCYVNGVAAGAGANLAIACDITLASPSASFIQSFSNIGLVPDSGGTFFLPRMAGLQRAAAMMMLGEKISAQKAEEYGMIYKVIHDENPIETALQTAYKLASMPTRALGLTKNALNRSLFSDLEKQLEAEKALQQMAGNTQDYKEGVQAFLEKRKPVFKGL